MRGVGSGKEDGESSADINTLGKVGRCLKHHSQNIRINLLGVRPK